MQRGAAGSCIFIHCLPIFPNATLFGLDVYDRNVAAAIAVVELPWLVIDIELPVDGKIRRR